MWPPRSGRRREQTGATTVEYAMMIAGICLVLLAGLRMLGLELTTFFDHLTGLLPH